MCGIVSIFNIQEQTPELRQQALRMSQKIRHRGPDWSGIYCGGSAILAHERLSIVDPESGRQPLFAPDKKQVLAVNGEIYNHQNIRARFAGKYQYQTGSDCEVILSLYREMRTDSDFDTLIYKGEDALHARISKMLEELNGIFAFALYDAERDEFLIARDPIGVIPLYIGYDKDGKVLVGGAPSLSSQVDMAMNNLKKEKEMEAYIRAAKETEARKAAEAEESEDKPKIQQTVNPVSAAEKPQELIDALSRYLKKQKGVKRAYLQLMLGEQPHYLIAVECDGDRAAVFAAIKAEAGTYTDLAVKVVDVASDSAKDLVSGEKPFYEKKRFGLFS